MLIGGEVIKYYEQNLQGCMLKHELVCHKPCFILSLRLSSALSVSACQEAVDCVWWHWACIATVSQLLLRRRLGYSYIQTRRFSFRLAAPLCVSRWDEGWKEVNSGLYHLLLLWSFCSQGQHKQAPAKTFLHAVNSSAGRWFIASFCTMWGQLVSAQILTR